MNRTQSTPCMPLQNEVLSPSRRPPLAPYPAELRSTRRCVPSLDGGASPFGDLSLARQTSMRLPPLTSKDLPAPPLQGRWFAPASRESELLGASLDLPPAPASAPAEGHRKSSRRSSGSSKSSRRRQKELMPLAENRLEGGASTRCSSASETSLPLSPSRPDAPISGSFGWTRGSSIGAGAHACVFKALEKQTGRIFAVKQSPLGEETDDKFRERLEEELRICKDLRHPNIVACLGFECTNDTFYIYLEYVPGGSMSKLLKEFGPLDGLLLRQCSEGVLAGLDYLHTRNPPVVHRDIKGANILVDLNFNVKLSDFGCSKREDLTKSFTTIGSIPWMAPEVISQQQGHGRKADIWSMGCAVLEMATAEKPWGNDAFDNVMYALRHISMTDAIPPIPDTLGEAGEAFVRLCVQRDPNLRPSAATLRHHSWFDS